MAIKNLTKNKKELSDAIKNGSDEAMDTALLNFAQQIQDSVLDEAREIGNDNAVLQARGMKPLTNAENKYYNEVINNKDFVGTDELVPATIFERVFDDLEHEHGLLNKINFVNTTSVTEFITSRGVNPAWWGKLCAPIKELLDNGFDVVNMHQFKLSAYLPVCKAMLDLGPIWLDKYVRTVLVEAMKIGLEDAIVSGDGAEQPIGMMMDVKTVTDGKHAEKAAIDLKDFSPATLGSMMSQFSTVNIEGVENPYYRNLAPEDVIMVVNPADYWSTIYPSITRQVYDGSWYTGLPVPFTIIQSVAVPAGKMVAGVAKDYFMGLGSTLKFEVSDEYHFVEDERIYLAKQYANGQPKSNDSFVVYNLPTAAAPETPEGAKLKTKSKK